MTTKKKKTAFGPVPTGYGDMPGPVYLKPTPGPWEAQDGMIIGDVYGAPRTLARLFHDGPQADCDENEIPDREEEGNAALIASAPDLLRALEQGGDIISGLEAEADNAGLDLAEVRAWWQKAAAVLAKAKGAI